MHWIWKVRGRRNKENFKTYIIQERVGREWTGMKLSVKKTGSYNRRTDPEFPCKQATLHLLHIINTSRNTLYHELQSSENSYALCVTEVWIVYVQSSWNVMAHGDAREGNWWGNWRMEWVASTLHTTSEHGVSSISTADAHTSAASSRLNWRPPADLNGLVRYARKTKSGFCACAITFQTQSASKTPMHLTQ